MTGEVKHFPRAKREIPQETKATEPHVETIETLGALLQLAKDGMIHGFAAVWSDPEGNIGQCLEPSDAFDTQKVIGSLVLLTHDISEQLRGSSTA